MSFITVIVVRSCKHFWGPRRRIKGKRDIALRFKLVGEWKTWAIGPERMGSEFEYIGIIGIVQLKDRFVGLSNSVSYDQHWKNDKTHTVDCVNP